MTHGERLYFDWLTSLVCRTKKEGRSWSKLFRKLHETEFVYELDMDASRADDGIDLRYRFAYENGFLNDTSYCIGKDTPCSMLEMMIALAIRLEGEYMADPAYGNRTHDWFFHMLYSLGISMMHNGSYNDHWVTHVMDVFMDRQYDNFGRGGLFIFEREQKNLQALDIWDQMMLWLNETEG